MTPRFAGLFFAVAIPVTLAACYDWQIGAGSGDAASGPEASLVDARADHADVGAPAPDAGRSDAQGALDGASHFDAAMPADAKPSCATLAANADAARAQAQACTLGSATECTTSVPDHCGCQQFVADPSGTATTAYQTAVDELKTAGCTTTCAGCPATVPSGLCLDTSTGSGVVMACSP
jgi:hypothetical protein